MAPRPTAPERIREFAILADQILHNPVVVDGLRREMRFEADPHGPPGRGTWTFIGPNEYLMRALLLDVRNVIQAGDLELGEVLRDLEDVIPDGEASQAIDGIRARLVEYGERGMTTENGKPLRPAEVVRLWMYAVYHHRDLSKLRTIRALDPIVRMVHQQEFLDYLGNVCNEVMNVRHMIEVARARGLLTGVEIPEWQDAPMQAGPDPRQVALLALLARVAAEGGTLTMSRADIEGPLEAYGGIANATLHIDAAGGGGQAITGVRLRAGRRASGPEPGGDPGAQPNDDR